MKSAHWKTALDKVTEKFARSFESFTEAQLNYKPNANTWSIAQNIAHLIVLNNSYFHYFNEIKRGTHVLPPIQALEQLASHSIQTVSAYTNTDRLKRANTWNIWQPSSEKSDIKIWENFSNHQLAFKKHIDELEPFFQQPTYIQYPGETMLVFRLEDCISFLIAHENRHWIQALEIKIVV